MFQLLSSVRNASMEFQRLMLAFTISLFWVPCVVCGTPPQERWSDWPAELTVRGTIALSTDTQLPPSFFEKYLPQSSSMSLLLLTNEVEAPPLQESFLTHFQSVAHKAIPAYSELLSEMLDQNADVICWFDSRDALAISAEEKSSLATVLKKQVNRGKTLIALGPCASLVANQSIGSKDSEPVVFIPGMNLIPDAVLLTECEFNPAIAKVLRNALVQHPKNVGVALGKSTQLILRGRKIEVHGKGQATFALNASDHHQARLQVILPQSSTERRRPENFLIDLTEWRRDAIDRTLELFPPAEREIPNVERGALLIVGGGGMPRGLMSRFVELAGGAEQAKLVYVPCEEDEVIAPEQNMLSNWRKMGVTKVLVLHTKDRNRANQDEDLLQPLREATGVWFGGGRQWNLADSYYGTTAHRLMKEVVTRGGVVGGSSAGASIQAAYLARATPIENFKIMAPGYERGGLGFLRGVAIDQHFSQRKRQSDMTQLVTRYPQLLGIGIDESTAIEVRGSKATVRGPGKVYFYDSYRPRDLGTPDYESLSDGQSYDLARRVILK